MTIIFQKTAPTWMANCSAHRPPLRLIHILWNPDDKSFPKSGERFLRVVYEKFAIKVGTIFQNMMGFLCNINLIGFSRYFNLVIRFKLLCYTKYTVTFMFISYNTLTSIHDFQRVTSSHAEGCKNPSKHRLAGKSYNM